MNIKIYRIVIAFALLFLLETSAYTRQLGNPLSDITVGTKTSDSSGTISISNSSIQSSIISTISSLSGYQITSAYSTLLVSDSICYLVFKASVSSGDTLSVAVQLVKTSSNSLIFRQHGLGDVNTVKSIAGCPSCKFFRNRNKIVIGSMCSVPNFETLAADSGCQNKRTQAD